MYEQGSGEPNSFSIVFVVRTGLEPVSFKSYPLNAFPIPPPDYFLILKRTLTVEYTVLQKNHKDYETN